jgi:hypothetical protein
MQFLLGLVFLVIFVAIVAVIGFGVALGIVYGLLWLLNDLLGIHYAAASSTAFVLFMIGAVLQAIGMIFKFENKLMGFFVGLYALIATPIAYAAAFNAHRIWTNADVVGDSPYLPGQFWAFVSENVGAVAAQILSVAPALNGLFQTISENALLTGIVASAFSSLIFQPMARAMYQQAQTG